MQRRKNMFRPRKPLGSFLLTTTTFIAFMAIIWHAYQDNITQNRAEASVPLIRASVEPIKSKPTDEMGMEIPYQDMLVFDQIEEPFAGKERDVSQVKFMGDESAEDTLPPMQELTKLDQGFDASKAKADEKRTQVAALLSYDQSDNDFRKVSQDEAGNVVEEVVPFKTNTRVQPVKATTEETTLETAAGTTEETTDDSAATDDGTATTETSDEETATTTATEENLPQNEKVLIIKKQETASEDTIKAPPSEDTASTETTGVAGDYIVQLGSVRTVEGAKEEWSKLSQKLPGVLTNLSLNVEKADLGAKGVFYRIQGGNVSKNEASSICDKIKTSTGKDCLIKKVQ